MQCAGLVAYAALLPLVLVAHFCLNCPCCVQRESQNNNAFESVYTFQDLDVPDAQRIRGLESLLGGCARHTMFSLVRAC